MLHTGNDFRCVDFDKALVCQVVTKQTAHSCLHPEYRLIRGRLDNRKITVKPPHIGDKHFVHCSEVVPTSEVEMYGQYRLPTL